MSQSNLNTLGGRVWYWNAIRGLSGSETGIRYDGFYGNRSIFRTTDQAKTKAKWQRSGKYARSFSQWRNRP